MRPERHLESVSLLTSTRLLNLVPDELRGAAKPPPPATASAAAPKRAWDPQGRDPCDELLQGSGRRLQRAGAGISAWLTRAAISPAATIAALAVSLRTPEPRRALLSPLLALVPLNEGRRAAFGSAAMATALLLGGWLVGRRVERLITQARRVAGGDFTYNNDDDRSDDLGRLAHELNVMTQRLADAHEEICRERHSRTRILEQLRHSDRLSTIGRIASSVAHELGTPLNVVSGHASMIAAGDVTDAELRESARVITEQAARMASIIRQLLSFARAGGVVREHTDVCAVVHRAKNLMEPLAERSEVAIVLTDRGAVEAAVDEGKVLQVLTNLMMNGIEAMPNGGTLTVSVDSRAVRRPPDHRAAPGEYVRICVRDQGTGIDLDELELIFDPFFTTRPGCNGTGLGLPVCQGIIEEHGGWLEVETHPGAGSCFSVNLPVRQEEAQREPQPAWTTE